MVRCRVFDISIIFHRSTYCDYSSKQKKVLYCTNNVELNQLASVTDTMAIVISLYRKSFDAVLFAMSVGVSVLFLFLTSLDLKHIQ